MSAADTAVGWRGDFFDRLTGGLYYSPGPIISSDGDFPFPRTPLLKPLELPAPSPPPLSLPPALRPRTSPLKSQDALARFCACASTPPRGTPRSPLSELKTDTNRYDADGSPSSKSGARIDSATVKSKACSPSSRGLFQIKSGKRSFSDSGEKTAKENEEQEKVRAVIVVSPFKKKRPPKLQIPSSPGEPDAPQEFQADISVEGQCYGVYSKKGGKRKKLEDAYQVLPEIDENSTQAFFGIFDGHGGRVAADFAASHLSRNICEALGHGQRDVEAAVRLGYLSTDAAFLEQQVSSGTSCVTAFVRNGSLVVANAGDCRAVMSKNGVAVSLTRDHTLAREDERRRVEDLGGYVDCFSGVWRLQGVLAVSRGIGDLHLKEWVSAEPEIQKLTIDPDCDFLLLASDGLWDVVSNQEAIDCVASEMKWSGRSSENLAASSKKLACLAASRGSHDDTSVMVVNLRHFCAVQAS